jgi:hypothetical protein
MTLPAVQSFLHWYLDEVVQTNQVAPDLQVRTPIEWLNGRHNAIHGGDFPFDLDAWRTAARARGLTFVEPWDFQGVMAAYCHDDVTLLRVGFEKFRDIFKTMFESSSTAKEIVGFDPAKYITIASFCKDIFMCKFYNDRRTHIAALDYQTDQFCRRGFHGGRTEMFKPFLQVEHEEAEIRYVDFTSQYPYVNKYGWYTIGKPVTIVNNRESILSSGLPDHITRAWNESGGNLEVVLDWLLQFQFRACNDGGKLDTRIAHPMNGLAVVEMSFNTGECTIPVLPVKLEKLIFPTGTFHNQVKYTTEMFEAKRQGYTFFNVTKILWWPMVQCETGLFQEYIDTFLKLKMEAGGWPEHCTTPESKAEHLQRVYDVEGIKLEPENIRRNKGNYKAWKLALNTAWGKWCQRPDLPRTEIFRDRLPDRERFYSLVCDETVTSDWEVMFEDAVQFRYKIGEEDLDCSNINVTIGGWTTSQARVMLYRAMSSLDPSQVMYCDTDSAIYYWDPFNPMHTELTLGPCLGDLTNEFRQDQRCVQFFSGGPKNYGYKVVDRANPRDQSKWEYALKVKGFNLKGSYLNKRSAHNVITYEKARDMTVDYACRGGTGVKLQSVRAMIAQEDNTVLKPDYDTPLTDEELSMLHDYVVQDFTIKCGKDSSLTSLYTTRTYNYVQQKRLIVVDDVDPHCINTVPHFIE